MSWRLSTSSTSKPTKPSDLWARQDGAGILTSLESTQQGARTMLRLAYFVAITSPRKVKPKGSPKQLKLVGSMWKLVEKNPTK